MSRAPALVLLPLLLAVGCEGQIGPAGRDGRDGLDGLDGAPGKDGVDASPAYHWVDADGAVVTTNTDLEVWSDSGTRFPIDPETGALADTNAPTYYGDASCGGTVWVAAPVPRLGVYVQGGWHARPDDLSAEYPTVKSADFGSGCVNTSIAGTLAMVKFSELTAVAPPSVGPFNGPLHAER